MYARRPNRPQTTPREQGSVEQQIYNLKRFIDNELMDLNSLMKDFIWEGIQDVRQDIEILRSDMRSFRSDMYQENDKLMSAIDPEFTQEDPPQDYEYTPQDYECTPQDYEYTSQNYKYNQRYDSELATPEEVDRMMSMTDAKIYDDDRSSGYDPFQAYEDPNNMNNGSVMNIHTGR